MRWDRLFADLAAEFDASSDAELQSEITDRIWAERARLRLVDRLRGSADRVLDVRLLGAGSITGSLRGVGPDWCLLSTGLMDNVVRLGAVLDIAGMAAYSAEPGSEGAVAARFGLTAVVRRLARDRAFVSVLQVDGGLITGVVELAGADILELTNRQPNEPRRMRGAEASQVVRRTVPLDAIAVIRHEAGG